MTNASNQLKSNEIAENNPGDAINAYRHEYMLLGRLQQDCEYYLGAGNRLKKHLWALDEKDQIKKMREIYAKLPEKPEWLTLLQIDQYEQAMLLGISG